MNDREKYLDNILRKISSEISITDSMTDKAVSSYESVGKWLGDGITYDVHVMPQGSMSLGTVVKPVSDRDDYDIDLVCLLEDGYYLSAAKIKKTVGDRLKEHSIYRQKIESEGEGRRCWKLRYDEFHMDILPCVPKTAYIDPFVTDIRLTHKNDNDIYEDRYSNPAGYHRWFEGRMEDILIREKQNYAVRNKLELENVPTYRVKTPLQIVIQLLKRHRDICFESNPDIAPISIIITTLAAHAYNGETSVYEALCNILQRMKNYIEIRNGAYYIANPVIDEENFADKWAEYPERRQAFFNWMSIAQKELVDDPVSAIGIDQVKRSYSKALGDAPVTRAIKALGYETQKDRLDNKLYSSGLTTGLTTSATKNTKQMKEHTFFGEE